VDPEMRLVVNLHIAHITPARLLLEQSCMPARGRGRVYGWLRRLGIATQSDGGRRERISPPGDSMFRHQCTTGLHHLLDTDNVHQLTGDPITSSKCDPMFRPCHHTDKRCSATTLERRLINRILCQPRRPPRAFPLQGPRFRSSITRTCHLSRGCNSAICRLACTAPAPRYRRWLTARLCGFDRGGEAIQCVSAHTFGSTFATQLRSART
jgi:hypothetical protein